MPRPGDLFDLDVPGGDHEELVAVQHPPSGLRAIIAVHALVEGSAAGGIRRMRYPDQAGALTDALGLAQAMSHKCALAELPAGGAKAVILDHPDLDQASAYRRLGETVEALGGRYLCGPDIGTGPEQLEHVRQATAHVNPIGNDPGTSTARGVLAGIRGLATVLDGSPELTGKRVVVQGLGEVGLRLARGLVQAGAEVLGADPDETACKRARAAGVELVAPEQALATACDILAPCALGGVLTEQAVGRIQARGICGSANQQLASPAADRALWQAGILYAPDVLVNAGAVIEGVLTTKEGATEAVREAARDHILATEERLVELLDRARRDQVPPGELAYRLARQRLAERRDG